MQKRLFRGALFLLAVICVIISCFYVYNVWYIESKDPLLVAPATTHFIDVGGERYAYSEIDNDSATTVLFVGGLSAWNGTWQRVIDVQNARTKKLNYVALDLPPFGYSMPRTDQDFFRNTQARRIASFIDAKKFKKVILVGHSYGGGPVTEYAMQNSSKVQKLILIDAVLNAGEHKKASRFSPVDLTPLRTGGIALLIHSDAIVRSRLTSFVYVADHIDAELSHLYTRFFNTEGVSNRLSRWVRDYVHDPLEYASTDVEQYRELLFPVRLIWGNKDTLTPIDGAKALLPIIPHVRLYTLENVGHIPMIEDYPAFDAALSEALDK